MATDTTLDNWLSSWPDAVAFALGLAVARWAGWKTGDLLWSLWLSSLVVGYATIVWMIAQPAAALAAASWRDRAIVDSNPRTLMTFWLILAVGVVFFLGFFTIHFVGFHYGHSQLLISFFPIDPGGWWPSDGCTHVHLRGDRAAILNLPAVGIPGAPCRVPAEAALTKPGHVDQLIRR